MRWNAPLLSSSNIARDKVLPVRIIHVHHYGHLVLVLNAFEQSSVVNRARLLHCLPILVVVSKQVILESLLHLEGQSVAVFTHHLLSETDCFSDVVFHAEHNQILTVEAGEDLLATGELAVPKLKREHILHQL
jgi:hypothetical protein